MEVDERLRWLEGKTNSSLHPKGEDLRGLLVDEENRSGFLEFCNNSESRHIFIHMSSDGRGPIKISKQPPSSLSSKSLFLLKCNSSSRITKDSISHDVVYSECSDLPLEHLELLVREVYLPMMSSTIGGGVGHSVSSERIMDLIHRLMGSVQVTEAQECGELVLIIPSLDVLSEWMMSGGGTSSSSVNQDRRSTVIHVMETCVVSWMKQVKIAIHFDPNNSILKADGKVAGPLSELKYWDHRLYQLMSVRDQLRSPDVFQILRRLEQVHSSYTDTFLNVHRDIAKAINDCELALVYLNTLKPSFLQVNAAYSPDTLIRLFPSLITTLALVWQHSGFYSITTHFHRLLRLISNELSVKARAIIGEDILVDPSTACTNIRLALRMCSAFRGHYLDRKDICENIWLNSREEKQHQQSVQNNQDELTEQSMQNVSNTTVTVSTYMPSHFSLPLCPWPARNAAPFHRLNMTMERCNDLLELVQTIEHFSELSAVASLSSSDGLDPILTDIYNDFNTTLAKFESSTKDLLSIDFDSFEESFFSFRSSVKILESRLSSTMLLYFEECSTLESSLRVLESFQGLISRDSVKEVLQPKLDSILNILHSDILSFRSKVPSIVTHPPLIPNAPPTSTRLIWLKAVEHRITEPLERIREAALYLLEGEKGFTLRRLHAEVIKEVESNWKTIVSKWTKAAPVDIDTKLQQNILEIQLDDGACNSSNGGVLMVNYDSVLEEVLREIHYFNGPVLSLNTAIPTSLRVLSTQLSSQSLHLYKSSLEVCVRLYNETIHTLSDIHKSLFQHKLQQLDILIQEGVNEINWVSTDLPDYLAKLKGMLTLTLVPVVNEVLHQTHCIEDTVKSWSEVPSLDIFQQSDVNELTDIIDNHGLLINKLQSHLELSMKTISSHVEDVFKVVDISRESPSWINFLTSLDDMVLSGLKDALVQTFSSLSFRAQRYEQGGTIPPLVGVSLSLHGKKVIFEPPLSSTLAIKSVPEIIRKIFNETFSITSNLKRLLPNKENYYTAIVEDFSVQSVTQKITAHVETSARQCQSLCKRFTQYSFLWEQDVIATFNSFIMGMAEPHPRKFTRPETVNRTRSASQSARSRGQSAKLHSTSGIQSNSIVMEVVTGYSDWEFLKPDGSDIRPPTDNDRGTSIATHNGGGVRGNGNTPSLQPPGSGGSQHGKHKKTTSLEDFEGELSVFQGILERLNKSSDSVEVGWIQVDQLPIKDTLITLANKWIFVYTNYLEKKVLSVLNELEEFFVEIEPEVESINGDEVDPSHIMKLVTILNKVNSKQVTMDGKFGAVHRAVTLLEKFKHPLSVTAQNQFEAVPNRWSSLKKRLSLSKQRLTPHVQSHSAAITKDLTEFDDRVQSLHNSFLASECLNSDCDINTAFILIHNFINQLSVYQAQYEDLMELQELLQSAVVNFSLLKLFEEELKTTGMIWQETEKFILYQEDWKSSVWTSVNTDDIKMSCDSQLTTINSMSDFVDNWNIKITLVKEIEEILQTIPLIDGLCSPFMRPRHWKQVLKYSSNLVLFNVLIKNGAVDINTLNELTFGKMMELRLMVHSAEVLAIVDKASKDITVEELLKNLEEVWLSMTFQFKSHTRLHGGDQAMNDISSGISSSSSSIDSRPSSSVKRKSVSSGRVSVISTTPTTKDQPVLLLENINEIISSLNHYQSSLQNLHGSITASSFGDELHQWHKQLQTVEAVLMVWMKVQSLWVQLEEVLSSKEVEQHLPTQYFMFTSTMDKEWRALMKETAKTPNVLKVCLQEDLLSMLEKFLDTLSLCRSALLNYMESRRTRCPWFYFLQLEDILNLVCYGSRVQILSECIPKLIPYSSGLILIDSLPGSVPTPPVPSHHHHHASSSSPYITGVMCSDGQSLYLAELIRCDGPVESIINHLMYSIEKTLTKQLETCFTESLTMPDPNGLPLDSLQSLWESTNTHQVIVLTTQMIIHRYITNAIQSNQSNDTQVECLESIMTNLKHLLSNMDRLIGRRSSLTVNDTPLSVLSNLPNTRVNNNTDSLPDSFGAVKASESYLTSGSGQASDTTGDTPTRTIPKGDSPATNASSHSTSSHRHQYLFSQLVTVVLSYITKIRNLMNQSHNDILSLTDSIMHYSSTSNGSGKVVYSLNGARGVGMAYGLCHVGGVPAVTSPHLEDIARHVLQTINNNCFGLFCSDQSNLLYTVKEIGAVFGYRVFPVICSSNTTHNDLLNIIKGIASTGCWLYLHNVHLLPVQLMDAVVLYLNIIKRGKQAGKSTIEINGETLNELKSAFCIASTNRESLTRLPPSVHSVFQTYMCEDGGTPLVNDIRIESLLISSGFKNIPFIKNCFSSLHKSINMNYELIKSIVNRSLDHTHYISTTTSNDDNTVSSTTAGFISSIGYQVMTAMSQSNAITSSKYTLTPSRKQSAQRTLQNITEEDEEQDDNDDLKHDQEEVVPLSYGIEVTAIVIAIWEILVPQYTNTTVNTLLLSLEASFPGVDVNGILAKANGLCGEMTEHYSWSRETIESIQESRATSVMYNEQSDTRPTSFIEETILQSCLLGGLDPCSSFLHTVHSLILQLTHTRVVTVSGPAGYTGKRGVVDTCIEAMRMMGHNVTINRIPIDTLGEEHLLGNKEQKGEGLLSYLDFSGSSPSPSIPSSSSSVLQPIHLVLLEGSPSHLLMDALQWLTVSDCLLTILNMKSIILDNSVKFIIMSPDSSPSLSPSLPVGISVSSDCITWRSIVQQSLLPLDKSLHYSILDLCDIYLPGVLETLSNIREKSVHVQMMPNQLQLVKSMCRILKCLFRNLKNVVGGGGVAYSDDAIERGFIYSLIWSFGIALDDTNKDLFQQYMKTTFTQSLFPIENGSLWEYTLEGDECSFKQCQGDIVIQDEGGSFVYTNKTAAINELLKLLYHNNVSVLFNGPVGSGKTSFIANSIHSNEGDNGLSLLHLLMNEEYATGDMWTQLRERLTWHSGMNYVPMDTETLVVMVDDLHLSQMKSSPSNSSIHGLIHHHISTGTVCVPNKEHSVSNTVYTCTTTTTTGTNTSTDQQLFDDMLYIHWDQYSSEELVSIYVKVLSSHFLSDTPTSIDPTLLSLLVHSSVQIHTKINHAFIPREDRQHYLYTLSTLDSVMRTLIFQWTDSCTPIQLLTMWLQEMYWVYSGRMTSVVDREVFGECVTTAIKKYFCDHPLLSQLLSLVSHKLSPDSAHSLQTLLTQTRQHLDLTTPTPHPYLHDSIIEISSQITHHLHLPHTLSSLTIVGMTEMEYIVQLISVANGYTLVRPSQLSCGKLSSEDNRGLPSTSNEVYNLLEFKNSLKNIYSMAALKNEKVFVYLDDHELVGPAHLPTVYQFIKDCSISVNYTSEEKDKLTNALRPDVCAAAEGDEFNKTKAWIFFINRVRQNVRFLISLADFTIADIKGLIHSKDMINSTKIIYQLPWDRKYLLQIAKDQLKSSLILPHHLIDNTTHLLSTLHIRMCETMHRMNLRTPTNEHYQYLVQRFCHELNIWMKRLSENVTQLNTAIKCVTNTKETVDQLQNKLKRETVVMEEKMKSYSQLTVQMGQDMAIAEEQNKLVAKQTERIHHLQQVLPEYEHVYQQYVEELVRIEDNTKDIALQLDQQSLLDLRSQTKPPVVVQDLLEAVIIVVKSPTADLSWNKGAKRLMANVDRFREMLMEFSHNQEVSEVLLSALHSYTNKSRFNEDDMIKDSGGCIAAGQLCAWVLGVRSYHKMLCDSIRPIDSRRTHVKASLHEYTEKLSQLQQKVKVLDDRLEGLGSTIEQASIDKSQQAKVVFEMKKELKQAEKLVKALSCVSDGWSAKKDQLSTALSHHIGPLSVGVAFFTYLSEHPPNIVQYIVHNVLRPCVTDIGFTIDDDCMFTGLLDELYPELPLFKQVPAPQAQSSDSVSITDNSDSDSFPNQCSAGTEKAVGAVAGPTQYMDLYRGMIASLSSPTCGDVRLHTTSLEASSSVWMDIVLSTWNKWPLISDPENFLQFGKEWNIVYAKEITYEVIHSLEQAMIEGHKVVLTNLQVPFHPMLLPVIEVGLKWNNFDTRSPFIEFCGRRLHINRSFKLVLTTPMAHEQAPPNNGTLLINMAPDVSIIQSKLFHNAIVNSTTAVFNFAEYSTIVVNITNDRDNGRRLNDDLLRQLKRMEEGESMMVTVDGVEHVMANMTKVVTSLQSLYSSLKLYHSHQLSLESVCTYGSIVYMLLYRLRERNVWFSVSLFEYQQYFMQALSDEDVVRCCEDGNQAGNEDGNQAGNEDGNQAGNHSQFESTFRKTLVRIVSDKLQVVMPYPDLMMLMKGLVLIDQIDCNASQSLANQIDQILYIIDDEDYAFPTMDTQRLDSTPPLARPDIIPNDLYTKILALPVRPATLEGVYKSMCDRPTEWEELLTADRPNPYPLARLPWMANNDGDDSDPVQYTLEDLVILKTISLPLMQSLDVSHDHTIQYPVLQEVLQLGNINSNLLLLLYSNEDLVSQINMVILEDTLNKCIGTESKTSIVFDGCSLSVDNLFSKMSLCEEDVVIVKNSHLLFQDCCSNVSKRFIDFIGGDFHRKGKLLIILIDLDVAVLEGSARDILSVSDCVNLSSVLPMKLPKSKDISVLDKMYTTNSHLKYLHSMMLTLLLVPQILHTTTLSQPLPKLVFLLAALHCHITTRASQKKKGNAPRLQTFINCLNLLKNHESIDGTDITVATLETFFKHQYLTTIDDCDSIVESFIQPNLLNDDSAILMAVDGLPLPLPSTSVPVEQFSDYVIGIIDSLQSSSNRNN